MVEAPVDFLTLAWLPLAALIAPLMAWVVEQWWPAPHVVEEVLKFGLVWAMKGKLTKRSEVKYVALLGLLFAGTEMVIYLMTTDQSGLVQPLIWRLVTTIPMHLMTILAIYTGIAFHRAYLGLTVAIVLHWGFNWLVR